jgi:hypothetical protein
MSGDGENGLTVLPRLPAASVWPEQTVKPIIGYLGLLLLCLLTIAFVPAISTALPRAFGY